MIARQLALAVLTFVAVMLATFVVSRLAPSQPAGDEIATRAAVTEWQTLRGIDAPVLTQLTRWLGAAVRFDFGSSFVDGRPVRDRVLEGLRATVPLALIAGLLAYALGIPLGFVLALYDGRRLARLVTFTLFALHGVPIFCGALALALLAHGLGLPTPRANALAFGFAVACLTYPALARIARYQRAAVIEALGSPFVAVARAKGLPERVVLARYVLRATLIAPLGLAATELPALLGGSVIVERIFTLPGMGMLAFESILHRDLPVVLGITAFVALVAMASTIGADLLYAVADPRRRL